MTSKLCPFLNKYIKTKTSNDAAPPDKVSVMQNKIR